MRQTPVPELIDAVLREPENVLVQRAQAEGLQAVGVTCSYVPRALPEAGGLFPLRLRAREVNGTPLADTYMSSVLCPYSRSLMELALEGRFDFLAGWVNVASCDHARRLHDNLEYLAPPPFSHLLDVPHKRGAPALDFYVTELTQLRDRLGEALGVDLGEAALTAAIGAHNGRLERLAAIAELRKRPDTPLTGTALHKMMVALATAPPALLDDTLDQWAAQLADAHPVEGVRARLLVVGSYLDEPALLALIEDLGGLVVADRFCLGSLPGLEPIDIEGDGDGEPLRALAAHSLDRTRCPRMMDDFDLRFDDLMTLVEDYRADGVVLQTLKFCDLWGVEGSVVTQALRERSVPVLRLEREYAFGGEGQLRTRVQAFLESLTC